MALTVSALGTFSCPLESLDVVRELQRKTLEATVRRRAAAKGLVPLEATWTSAASEAGGLCVLTIQADCVPVNAVADSA